jgi:hypothetical protein
MRFKLTGFKIVSAPMLMQIELTNQAIKLVNCRFVSLSLLASGPTANSVDILTQRHDSNRRGIEAERFRTDQSFVHVTYMSVGSWDNVTLLSLLFLPPLTFVT